LVIAMARLEFASSIDMKTTPERAFDYFADYRHVPQVLEGVSRWQPIGSRSRGLGARFDVEMVTLGVPLKNVLRLNRWRRPEVIGWESESGLIKQEGEFRLRAIPDGVRIELRIAYEPPGSVLGAAVARRMDSMVRGRLDRALEHIQSALES